ncbi:RNA polymerase sigma factor SigJ [Cellulomonas alba]|uniref:RNA polymerase sigma factor SigJ n=1 Tax=Cellulomonas alba TaxID=3053467 RepID=A0ABT7SH38_9CELL|nr:RNA polymerase sigma factor SigJ [Cellulomonas alba]MDM7855500.1 RNA polymerase sigma factor SigJ [Cellulomonas alba]
MTTPDGDAPTNPRGSQLSDQPRLINVAYRLLGSLSEAEDVVQEAYVRWYRLSPQDRAAIASPSAWLTTVTSRLCLDLLGSARVRREQYVGAWVPEPIREPTEWPRAGGAVDPAERITLDESVHMAFLVVLETMTPAERVAFILHDVYRYPFAEVAEIVGRTPAACRQLASSARARVRAARTPPSPTAEQADVVRRFAAAFESSDIASLIALLDPDATVIPDGGGRVAARTHPLEGAETIARYLVGLLAHAPSGVRFRLRTVNGRPGLVGEQDGVVATVFSFDVAGGRIRRIWATRNPDKLRGWRDVAGTAAEQAPTGPPT